MRTITAAVSITIRLALSTTTAVAQAPADAPEIGPVVLIDAAHHNLGGPQARESLVKFLEQAGFRVRELGGKFDRQSLEGVRIVIIPPALSAKNALPSHQPTEAELAAAWQLPTPSAFSADEITFLSGWVKTGGALLLVFDHMPLAGAAQKLAGAFGIEVSNGYAVDERLLGELAPRNVAQAGSLVFRRVDQTLAEHPITNGRSATERVDSAATYVGSAFQLPPEGESLLRLGPSFISLLPQVAWQFSDATPRESVATWSQGGVLRVERGRVAIFGEHGVLVTPAQVAAYTEDAGATPQHQNPQLLLNTLHWLLGLLDESQ